MRHELPTWLKFAHLIGVFICYGLIFWWANHSNIVWPLVVFAVTAVAVMAMYLFVSRQPLHLLASAIILIEAAILFQYWEARSRNKAVIALCIYWFVTQIINAPTTTSEFRHRMIIIGLIFLILYGMVIFTLPPEFQF